jgi:hypothetical protein
MRASRRREIPELAVVELTSPKDGGRQVRALGVVVSPRQADNSYTVEVADAKSGTFKAIRVSARHLRVRRTL